MNEKNYETANKAKSLDAELDIPFANGPARKGAEAAPAPEQPASVSDATQRVNLSGEHIPAAPRPRTPRSGNAPSRRNPGKPGKKRPLILNQRDKITLIAISAVVLVLVIGIIIGLSVMFADTPDDGRIKKGVMAAGVDLGGMTPEEAKTALEAATADTYTKLDMTVTVLDTTITLSPADTGAKLDVDAVVNAAYQYGREGSKAQNSSYIVPIIEHLNLDTEFIKGEINKLGSKYSSTLSQPTITITGTRPDMNISKPDTTVVHQTLTIFVGTAEYGLDTNKLYEQVLEYYNSNIFQVTGNCQVVAPESIEDELLALYEEHCVKPVDAQINTDTYTVTPEVYGYGFVLEKVKEQLASTPYGTTLDIPMTFIAPNLTEELLSGDLFKETLGQCESSMGIEANWIHNITLAIQKLDGFILKSGDEFSFNEVLGELTAAGGYKPVSVYTGKDLTEVVGGGVTHLASALYQCVLQADLEITQRHTHTYATSFTEPGRDVYVNTLEADFRFRNNLPAPICINAQIIDGSIHISIVGTDSRNYTTEIEFLTVKILTPGQLKNTMSPNNPGGYRNGQELVAPITGYDVEIYRYKYNKDTGALMSKDLLYTVHHASRDAVVVELQEPPQPTEPSVPTDPSDPSDPSEPTEPSGPSNTDPSGGATTPSDPDTTIPEKNPTVPPGNQS